MDVFSQMATDARPHLASAALWAAHALGLFPALASPLSLDALASRLALSSHRLRALLGVLALEGHLARVPPDGFVATRVPQRPPAPPPHGWGLLAEVLRSDRPLPEDGVAGTGGEALTRFHRHLCDAGRDAARETAALLAEPGGALLDLGAGAGVYSRAWLAATGGTAVLVDRPSVLDLARRELGAERGAAFVEGELLSDSVGDIQGRILDVVHPIDRTVLLANVLHLFGPADCARLVDLAVRLAGPGGVVAVKDLRLDDDHCAPVEGVLFSLNMALFTDLGRVHDTGALRGFFATAGLAQVVEHRLPSAPEAIVLAGRVPKAP